MKHIHHKIPRSRGGTDDSDNLEELDFIEHARIHAEDFLEGGPWFDFRHEGWPFLEDDLRRRVLEKASEKAPKIKGFGGDVSTAEQKSIAGKIGGPIGARNQPREVRVANARKSVQTRIERYGTPSPTALYECPCCGMISKAGPITRHLNSPANDCVGEKLLLQSTN
jgi:hypothetical protein